jgi:glucose-6-phosphate isomerase
MEVSPMFFRSNTGYTINKQDKTKKATDDKAQNAKALGLSLAALATISFAGMSVTNPQNAAISAPIKNTNLLANYTANHNKIGDKTMSVNFITPNGELFDYKSMQTPFSNAINKLESTKNTDKNLSWVNLPSKLIQENYVSSVYNTVNEFRKPFKEGAKTIFVALGNPSNSDEIANSMGLGANLVYDIDLTPEQNADTIQKAGGDLSNVQVVISSKSGSTFESNQTYKLLKDSFTKYYQDKGVAPENIQKEVSKHFLFITDKNPEKSKLKKQAQAEGIATIDAVDGLHSGFGDLAYSMPLLAVLGLPQESANKMLKSAEKMSNELQKNDLNSNIAAKMAAFDKLAEDKGAKKEEYIFHDAHFTDFTMLMQQLYKESLRKLDFTTSVYPRGAHVGLESDISKGINGQPTCLITNIYAKNPQNNDFTTASNNLDKAHQMNLQKEGHFQKNIELQMDSKGLTPEAVGEFVTLKSYLAYFKNEFETNGNNNMYEQDYVKGYKKIREGLETNK